MSFTTNQSLGHLLQGLNSSNTVQLTYHRYYTSNLTLSWRRPLSYRNQPINLQSKSMDWFLYDIGLRHERVKLHDKPRPKSQDMFLKIQLMKYPDYLFGIILKECSPYKTGNKDNFGLFCRWNKWLVSSSLFK